MEPKDDTAAAAGATAVIDPGRASVPVILGAVDAALRSDLPELAVVVELAESDPRHDRLLALCGDARVTVGRGEAGTGLVFEMPARARPGPRTLPAIAEIVRGGGAGTVEVPVPGRFPPLALVGGDRLRARGAGSGTRRLRPAQVGLRSTGSTGRPAPPPLGDLASERAEHLRHRARSATMRARMDRNAHRLSRERLQTRHERARLRLAEQRLGRSGTGEWVRWRSRNVARRAAALPGAAASATSSVRVFFRRARRFAVDRRRTRKLESGPGAP
jgi:hypothetical protein